MEKKETNHSEVKAQKPEAPVISEPERFRRGPWLNTRASALILGQDIVNEQMRALVVTDMHFGKETPIEETLPQFMRAMRSLIGEHKINVLFMLGDVLHGGLPNSLEILGTLLGEFDKLMIPVWIVPGNHDRYAFYRIDASVYTNVKISRDYLLGLKHPRPRPGCLPCIFLGHDIGNRYHLEMNKVPSWIRGMKQLFSSIIHPEDFLMTGHAHHHFLDKERRCATLGQFAPDHVTGCYALITAANRFRLDFRTVRMADFDGA
jgi:DNA repair exonuclease SbcCD nuclease subunit